MTYDFPMTNRHSSKALVGLLSLSLLIIGSTVASGADYPPKPGDGLPPVTGETGHVVVSESPEHAGDSVFVPKAKESHVVLKIKVESESPKAINSLHSAKLVAVQVEKGLVLGGVANSGDVPKVLVDSKGKSESEIQAPRNTPISISKGGYTPGQGVTVIITENGKSINLGTFFADRTGKLTLPSATLTGSSNETFSFKSKGKTEKVILRPSAKSGFSTLKAHFSK